jgi:hypothetical protein
MVIGAVVGAVAGGTVTPGGREPVGDGAVGDDSGSRVAVGTGPDPLTVGLRCGAGVGSFVGGGDGTVLDAGASPGR